MECPVCYSADAKLTIRCGHAFCKGCVTKWLESSKEEGKPGCPMCRTPILFKGLQKIEQVLEEKRYENQCDEVVSNAFDAIFEQYERDIEKWAEYPLFRRILRNATMDSMRYVENVTKVLKDIDYAYPEDIEYHLYEEPLEVNYKREMKRINKQYWQQRDKFQTKVPRRAPRMSIRR
jgi:Ring finger domain